MNLPSLRTASDYQRVVEHLLLACYCRSLEWTLSDIDYYSFLKILEINYKK